MNRSTVPDNERPTRTGEKLFRDARLAKIPLYVLVVELVEVIFVRKLMAKGVAKGLLVPRTIIQIPKCGIAHFDVVDG